MLLSVIIAVNGVLLGRSSSFAQLHVAKLDLSPCPQVRSLAHADEARGLLWLLEEEALVPGATEDALLDRLFSYYGPQEGDKKGRWWCLEDSPSALALSICMSMSVP